MKITATINNGSKISTIDFYPNENILWVKTPTVHIRKEISSEHAMTLAKALTDNPFGNLIKITEPVKKVPFIEKISSNKSRGGW